MAAGQARWRPSASDCDENCHERHHDCCALDCAPVCLCCVRVTSRSAPLGDRNSQWSGPTSVRASRAGRAGGGFPAAVSDYRLAFLQVVLMKHLAAAAQWHTRTAGLTDRNGGSNFNRASAGWKLKHGS